MLDIGYKFQIDNREYTILELIGRGANTIAYLAERSSNDIVSKCILKEYAPQNQDDYAVGKERFISAGKMQNNIRQISILNNQTPPVSFIFEYSGIPFIDVSCYGGSTLSKLDSLTLQQYMEICLTISKTIGYYHRAGYLCLDVKPENIFILQNSPDDTITQLIEFIDFDSIRKISEVNQDTVISCTKGWAAPEQLNPQSVSKIGPKADIYTTGELVFFLLFGRHSLDSEHRSFSKYPFDECRTKYKRFVDRPDIRSLFTTLFRGTLRSSSANRFDTIDEVTNILEKIVDSLKQMDYVIPKMPVISPYFTGRDKEIQNVAEMLKDNRILFLTGIGGIGKSTIVRNFIHKKRSDYDIIVYLEYVSDIKQTFTDDLQFKISTVSLISEESTDEYFNRKLKAFMNICTDKRVLFVLDNFSGRITKELSRIFECGFDTIIVTRNEPPVNSFASLEVKAIADTKSLNSLVSLNLKRALSKDEKAAFEEIIQLVQGHTLTIELIARQIHAGHLNIRQALKIIKEYGFTHFSEDKISNYKDGEEIYGTLSNIISALFSAADIAPEFRFMLKVLSLLDVKGIEISLLKDIVNLDPDKLRQLANEGWIYIEKHSELTEIVRLHPVISETIRNWEWDNESESDPDDISVMLHIKRVSDIYVGTRNSEWLKFINREAEKYSLLHPRHIIKALYHDICVNYYDMACVDYVPANNEEAEPIIKMIREMDSAVYEMEQSSDNRKNSFLPKMYLSLANVLIRGTPDGGEEAFYLLKKSDELIKSAGFDESEDRCYYNMTSAWYYSLIEPDLEKTCYYTSKAKEIAYNSFATELEIIDIIHIPTTNCLYFHGEITLSAEILKDAVAICDKHPDMLRYIDKKAELLYYMLDEFMEVKDYIKCRELISEIDKINDTYKDEGIFHDITEIKKVLS